MDGQQQYADAMRAFDAYYGIRRSKFGLDWPAKRYAEHRMWKSFMKIAQACDKTKRDVEKYVTTVMEHLPKNGDQIVPIDLLTKKAEQAWETHKDDRRTDASGKWAYLVNLVTQIQMSTSQSDEAILCSPFSVQFPAWFRVFYPESLSDKIVSDWGEEALEDLKNDRDLVRFLRAAMAGKVEAFEKKMGVINGL